jgi:SAM-dependent methyltransferase
MSIEPLRDALARLNEASGALAVAAAAIDARLAGTPLDARLAPHANAVLEALGVKDAVERATPADLRVALAPVRALSYLNAKLLTHEGRTPGWHHTEPEILQALGAMTHGLAGALRTQMPALLEGLGPRLDAPGAAFLDVGTGVAKLSIEIAEAFPHLRVVGVDPWEPALALARQNVAAAGLTARIELRSIGGEQIEDDGAFDLAWMASPFMPPEAVPRVAAAVLRALRPGGWALMALSKPASDDRLADAVWNFRIASFGGAITRGEDAVAALEALGYREVRVLPGPPGAVAALVAGRRAP